MTGPADFCSSGRKAWLTRTRPKTLVSKVARTESAVFRGLDRVARQARLDASVVDEYVEPAVGLDLRVRRRD